MNRYSWVCFGASTLPHPARLLAAARSCLLLLRQGARIRRGGGHGGGEALGRQWPGAPRYGGGGLRGGAGGYVRASHATRATILSGKRDYFSPAAREKPSKIALFSQPEPPHAGPGSGHGANPSPTGTRCGGRPPPPRPRATHHPDANKASEGKHGSGPWVPREGGRPPAAGAGGHYGGQRTML